MFTIFPNKVEKIQDFQKVQEVQRSTIPHFEALVIDNKIPEEQGCIIFKGLPCPFFLKSTLFTNKWTVSSPN